MKTVRGFAGRDPRSAGSRVARRAPSRSASPASIVNSAPTIALMPARFAAR